MEKELEFISELESVFIQPHLMDAIMESFAHCHMVGAALMETGFTWHNSPRQFTREAPSISDEDIKMALDQWEANNARTGLPFDRVRTERQIRANPGRFIQQIRKMKNNVANGRQMSTNVSSFSRPTDRGAMGALRERLYRSAVSTIASAFAEYEVPFDAEFELKQILDVENRTFAPQKARLDMNDTKTSFATFDDLLANKNVEYLRHSNSALNDLVNRVFKMKRALAKAKEAGVFRLELDRVRQNAEKSTIIRKNKEEKRVAHPRLSADDWAKFKTSEAKKKAEEDRKAYLAQQKQLKTQKSGEAYSVDKTAELPPEINPETNPDPNPGEGMLSFLRRSEKKPGEFDMEFASRLHQSMLKAYSEDEIKNELNWMLGDDRTYGPFCRQAQEDVSKMMIVPKDVPSYTIWLASQKVQEARRNVGDIV